MHEIRNRMELTLSAEKLFQTASDRESSYKTIVDMVA